MIRITVDEAYAFDYLSILQIKKEKGSDNEKYIEYITKELTEQISQKKFKNVISSQEYLDLMNSNRLTFDAVDKAKTDEVLASYVDICNYERMKCKQKLQTKFFSYNLTETKIGYEKIKKI
jgi:hypothetical protein